jgi:protein-disulfide isomerase
MQVSRRFLLSLASAASMGAFVRHAAAADSPLSLNDLMSERSFGDPKAPITVEEYFSLTCTHCAAFSREMMPEITTKFITPGKVRFVYHDYPLDQIALTAAMVARALPPERYEPFISALFASQDRWAFAPDGGDYTTALGQMALLAGLSHDRFEAVIADADLKQAILTDQQRATDQYKIDATPTFRCNGKQHSGELPVDAFVKFTGVKA